MRKKIILILLALFTSNVFSQISLYNGRNPYVNNFNDGDIIRINVNSSFAITINGDWNRNLEVNLKLQPDKKNLPFLNESEQSRNNQRQTKERQSTTEKLKFNISAIINRQAGDTYRINANKTIIMDGKITRIICTGLVNGKSIMGGTVNSDNIADLNLNIISQPQPARDESFTGNPEDQKETEGTQGTFSQEQIKKYILEHMKELLGALK
jgi:hypothetical protein